MWRTSIASRFGARRLGFWLSVSGGGAGGRGAGRAGRDDRAAAHLSGARVVPSARHVCAGADLSRRRAVAVGTGRSVRTARAASGGRGRFPRPCRLPTYDIALIVIGPVGAAAALVCADAHALGHAGARRDAGSRDARRARHQSGVAVHRRVFRRRVSRRPGRRAARAAHVGESVAGSGAIGNAFVVVVVGGMGCDSGRVCRRADHRARSRRCASASAM